MMKGNKNLMEEGVRAPIGTRVVIASLTRQKPSRERRGWVVDPTMISHSVQI